MSFWDIFSLGLYWTEKVSAGPLSEKEIRRIKNDIARLMEEGEKIFQKGQYFDARTMYIGALQLENILPSSSSESIDLKEKKVELTEAKVNEIQFDQITVILDNGDNFKNTEKYENAFDEYEKAFSIIDKMIIYDVDSRSGLHNTIVLRQINTLLDEGVSLKSEGLVDDAIDLFEYALNLTNKMFPSKEKQNIIKKIEKNLDIFSELIRDRVEAGKILMEQNRHEESIKNFQMAKEFIKKKYELLENSIPNRVKEVNEKRDINSLIEQSKLKRKGNENVPLN